MAEVLRARGFSGDRVKLCCYGIGSLEESLRSIKGGKSVDSSRDPLEQFAFIVFEKLLEVSPKNISISEPKLTPVDEIVFKNFNYQKINCQRSECFEINFTSELNNNLTKIIFFLPNLDNTTFSDFVGKISEIKNYNFFAPIIVVCDKFLARPPTSDKKSIKDE